MAAPKGSPKPPASGMKKGQKTKRVLVREAAQRAAAAEVFEANKLTAKRVLEEMRRLAFLDMRQFYDAQGKVKPMSEWTEEMGAAIGQTETIIKNAQAGDGVTDTVLKLKAWDKVRALEGLAKHFGLLLDRVEVSGSQEMIDILMQSRQKARDGRKL